MHPTCAIVPCHLTQHQFSTQVSKSSSSPPLVDRSDGPVFFGSNEIYSMSLPTTAAAHTINSNFPICGMQWCSIQFTVHAGGDHWLHNVLTQELGLAKYSSRDTGKFHVLDMISKSAMSIGLPEPVSEQSGFQKRGHT